MASKAPATKDGTGGKAGPTENKGLDEVGLDEEVADEEISLRSKEGRELTLRKSWANVSSLVRTSLENDSSAKEIPILGVRHAILALIVEYMKHHKGKEPPIVEKPLRSKKMKDVCKAPWDADFIDRFTEDRQTLYNLILAANYMDIKGLLHLGCAKVASLIKGQPLEKIKDILDPKTPIRSDDGKAQQSSATQAE